MRILVSFALTNKFFFLPKSENIFPVDDEEARQCFLAGLVIRSLSIRLATFCNLLFPSSALLILTFFFFFFAFFFSFPEYAPAPQIGDAKKHLVTIWQHRISWEYVG